MFNICCGFVVGGCWWSLLLDFGVSWVLCCDCWVLGCCGLMWVAGGWFGLGLVGLVDFVVLAACWFAGLTFGFSGMLVCGFGRATILVFSLLAICVVLAILWISGLGFDVCFSVIGLRRLFVFLVASLPGSCWCDLLLVS